MKKKLKQKREEEEQKRKQLIGQTVCRHYEIIELIDYGSFGAVYKGKRFQPLKNQDKILESYFAIKVEDSSKKDHNTLTREAKILFELKAYKGFPRLYYFIKNEDQSTMVTTLLGKNLDKLFQACKKKFSLKTLLMFAEQALSRLQYLHSKGFIHRDIKPENFMIGNDKYQNVIYLADFGLSNSYIRKDGRHIEFKDDVGLVGTARYTSLYSHLGYEQSRRDDLESLLYVMVYFYLGKLPWMNLKINNKEEKKKIVWQMKRDIKGQQLCQGMPNEFIIFYNYIRNLSFFEKPDYNYCKKIFRTLFLKMKFAYDDKFDWIEVSSSKSQQTVQSYSSSLTLEHNNDSKNIQPSYVQDQLKQQLLSQQQPNLSTSQQQLNDQSQSKSQQTINNQTDQKSQYSQQQSQQQSQQPSQQQKSNNSKVQQTRDKKKSYDRIKSDKNQHVIIVEQKVNKENENTIQKQDQSKKENRDKSFIKSKSFKDKKENKQLQQIKTLKDLQTISNYDSVNDDFEEEDKIMQKYRIEEIDNRTFFSEYDNTSNKQQSLASISQYQQNSPKQKSLKGHISSTTLRDNKEGVKNSSGSNYTDQQSGKQSYHTKGSEHSLSDLQLYNEFEEGQNLYIKMQYFQTFEMNMHYIPKDDNIFLSQE